MFVFQPDSVQNLSRLNASEVTDGHHVSPEQVTRDRLLSKINQTNEQLISEQNAKQRMYHCYYCYLPFPISRLRISRNTKFQTVMEPRKCKVLMHLVYVFCVKYNKKLGYHRDTALQGAGLEAKLGYHRDTALQCAGLEAKLGYHRDTALQGAGLEATYAVRLSLIGKPVVGFLLVII